MKRTNQRFAFIALTVLVIGTAFAAWAWTAQDRGPGMGMMQHRPMMTRQQNAPPHAPQALSRYGCMSCHALDQGRIGPAFRWVAWKYRNRPDAVTRLTAFIEHGGTSTWGGVMPDLNVPADQARNVAQWIMKQKPEQPPHGHGGQ